VNWRLSPKSYRLSRRTVHVWRLIFNQLTDNLEFFTKTLSPNERDRADRFRFEKDKAHFIVFTGALKTIIGRYLNCDPRRIQFQYSEFGKPYLMANHDGDAFFFNMAHSNHLAVIGFGRILQIGIDIEFIRPIPDIDEIGKRIFSPNEYKKYHSLPENQKQTAFFNCWTRKEAFIKAIGKGLSFPLDRFSVSFAPGNSCRIIDIDGDTEKASKWSLVHFIPAKNYSAALALNDRVIKIGYYTLTQTVLNDINRELIQITASNQKQPDPI
jgi:4'-phosphopantetheinyl transferase